MAFTPRPQPSASFISRLAQGAYTRLFGDMSEDDFIALLGFSPTDDTVIPQAGGKLYGALVESDVIDLRDTAFTPRDKPSASFIDRTLPA